MGLLADDIILPTMLKNPHPAIKILESYKGLVWPEIKRYLKDPIYPQAFKVASKYKKERDFHWRLIKEYPQRKGKYLRPTLLMLTAEAMGAKTEKAIKTAAAMQVSEDWILIHDDFEDNSLERRGKPTLHRMFGNELAVNAGDSLQIIMWKILADNQAILGQKKTFGLIDEFYRILSRTTFGQSIEIKWSKENKAGLTDEDWFFIADGKTFYYTIAGPVRLGAIIAGANQRQLETLAEFGIYLGRSFQIIDDVLDLTSDFAGLKKQTGNDIYEGKRTVILGHLLRSTSPADKKKLISILCKKREEKNQKEVAWVIQKMKEYRSLDYARLLATKLKEKALFIFEKDLKFLSKQPSRKNLETLIHFVLEREF